jgi:Protein of unknown function (DUF2786)
MEMDRERVLRRLRSLLAITTEAGATEHEPLTAAEKARAMMDRYRLTMSDLEIEQEGTIDEYVERPNRIESAAADLTWVAINRYCGTEHYYHTRRNEIRVRVRYAVVLGLKADVPMAVYLYKMICSAIARGTNDFHTTTTYRQATEKRVATKAFQEAMALRIDKRLFEMARKEESVAKTGSGTDLVVIKTALVKAAYDAIFPPHVGAKKTRPSRVKPQPFTDEQWDAWRAGQTAGDRVNLNRPLTATKTDVLDRAK